jgi:acyl dehydratase
VRNSEQGLATLNRVPVPTNQRFFEDYEAGRVYEFGTITVRDQDIVDFARQFDSQDFYVDPVKAASHPFGGIVASGCHTVSLAMRLYVDHYLSHVASHGSRASTKFVGQTR